MSSVPRRLAAFAVAVALLFAAGHAVGSLVEARPPVQGEPAPPHGETEHGP